MPPILLPEGGRKFSEPLAISGECVSRRFNLNSTDDDPRLTRAEASAYLIARGYRVAPATLAKLACLGGGPTFTSFGRRPLYRPGDLLAWVASRSSAPRRSTSSLQAA